MKLKYISFYLVTLLFMFFSVKNHAEPKGSNHLNTSLNNPQIGFHNSFEKYENVYVGGVVFDTIKSPKDSDDKEVYFKAKFIVNTTLKGKERSQKLAFSGNGIHGCVSPEKKESFINSVDKIALSNKNTLREMHGFLLKDKKEVTGVCFVAIAIFQGSIEDAYKSRYELLFEGQQYVLFVDDSSVDEDGGLKHSIEDISQYDAQFMNVKK